MTPPRPPVVFASPGVARDGILVADSLRRAGLLRAFATTWVLPDGPAAHSLPTALRERLSRRLVPPPLARLTDCYPAWQVARQMATECGAGPRLLHRLWAAGEAGFDRQVAARWAGRVPVLYGVEHATAGAFRRHKERGGHTLLWQVIAHPQFLNRMVGAELEAFPALAGPASTLWRADLTRSTAQKERQIADADQVVAISPFVARTFIDAGVPADRVVCVPSPCPPPAAEPPPPAAGRRVLAAGTLGFRKGTHLLLEAWRRLRPGAGAELLLVGGSMLPPTALADLPAGVRVLPAVSQPALRRLFRTSLVLALPTLAEGRANVVLEALAEGLPVVTTPNAGCCDLVVAGRTGWLVPAGDVGVLADRLGWVLDHPAAVRELGPACLATAAGWQADDFHAAHLAVVRRFLAGRGLAAPEVSG